MLYHCKDMFYLVTVVIMMHNMMVYEYVGNDERESKNFYAQVMCNPKQAVEVKMTNPIDSKPIALLAAQKFFQEVFQAAENLSKLLNAVPESLWWLFGAGYLGYTGARSFDKWRGVPR